MNTNTEYYINFDSLIHIFTLISIFTIFIVCLLCSLLLKVDLCRFNDRSEIRLDSSKKTHSEMKQKKSLKKQKLKGELSGDFRELDNNNSRQQRKDGQYYTRYNETECL